MWNRQTLAALAAVATIGLGLFVAGVLAASARGPELAQMEIRFSWFIRAFGVLLIGVSALAMLVNALLGASLERIAVLVLPVLDGAVLIQAHWSAAAALGAVVLTIIVRDGLLARAAPPGSPPSP